MGFVCFITFGQEMEPAAVTQHSNQTLRCCQAAASFNISCSEMNFRNLKLKFSCSSMKPSERDRCRLSPVHLTIF